LREDLNVISAENVVDNGVISFPVGINDAVALIWVAANETIANATTTDSNNSNYKPNFSHTTSYQATMN
jgi:hypothetical protein